ncbi:MAG: helix-turn-helix domain-containing protein [bacterium]|nr:helix-turn-helix domain-containing protein [bacterium]
MREYANAVHPDTGATKQEIVDKLEVAFEQIAAELNIPVDKVRNIVRGGYFSLKKGERQSREQTIRRLRREGYYNEDIAETLGLSVSQISHTVSKLIQEGRVKPIRRGRRYLSEEKRAKRAEQIVKLRQVGYSNEDIAEVLGLSVSYTYSVIRKLVSEGKLAPPLGKEVKWRDLENESTQTIIKMVKHRSTLAEIGNRLGLTKERVRQLILLIRQAHGEEVFATDNPLWTSKEVADKLGVTAVRINQICDSGEVTCRRRGSDSGVWLIQESEIDKLEEHHLITGTRTCTICDKTFVYKAGLGSRQVCSDKCLEEYHRQRRAAYADQQPSLDSLVGWRKDLWQRLQSHRIPKNEEWLTITSAARRSGLSKMQLRWMRLRNIVTIRPHPVKTWRGQPVATYAASEMAIARQAVY